MSVGSWEVLWDALATWGNETRLWYAGHAALLVILTLAVHAYAQAGGR